MLTDATGLKRAASAPFNKRHAEPSRLRREADQERQECLGLDHSRGDGSVL